MEWPAVLALVLAVPLILFPVVLIWFMNIKGIRDTARERRTELIQILKRRARTAIAVVVPVGIYAFLVQFFLGRFGWQAALAAGLVLPIVLFIPVLIWASVASGISDVLRDRLRRRAGASRRRVTAVRAVEREQI